MPYLNQYIYLLFVYNLLDPAHAHGLKIIHCNPVIRLFSSCYVWYIYQNNGIKSIQYSGLADKVIQFLAPYPIFFHNEIILHVLNKSIERPQLKAHVLD